MRAILLAAGKGSRISKNIPAIPKCTLDVDGRPLVQRTVEMLLSNGIEVAVADGYKHEVVEDVLSGYPVRFFYNPFYDVTNSIASLWLAREFLREETTIIANADVFWTQDVLDLLLAEDRDNVMLADERRADDGDYFFNVADGVLAAYGKELARDERNCEYVGIGLVSASFMPAFKKRLEDLVGRQEHGLWWENVLYSFADERDIHVADVGDTFWAEIDFIEDYKRIVDYIEMNH